VKRVEKLLTCPYGDAVYRPLAGLLRIIAPDGTELVPARSGGRRQVGTAQHQSVKTSPAQAAALAR
jgi:hypothetical protein